MQRPDITVYCDDERHRRPDDDGSVRRHEVGTFRYDLEDGAYVAMPAWPGTPEALTAVPGTDGHLVLPGPRQQRYLSREPVTEALRASYVLDCALCPRNLRVSDSTVNRAAGLLADQGCTDVPLSLLQAMIERFGASLRTA